MVKPYTNGRSHSPWRKLAIISIWAIEITLLAIYVVLVAILIPITNEPDPVIVKDKHKKTHKLDAGVPMYVAIS